jgi:hypothetical protein
MRKLSYLFVACNLLALIVFTGCKKKTTTAATTNPNPPIAVCAMNSVNKGNSADAITSLNVSTSTLNATLRLDVNSDTYIEKIYLMRSVDNGPLVPISVSTITNAAGQIFGGGAQTYSLSAPAYALAFELDIPVSTRTVAPVKSDVYYIWMTSGPGDFLKPAKNAILGPAVITLNYTGTLIAPYDSVASIAMGDQTAVTGSLLVTAGKSSALNTITYMDSPASADLSLSALDATGTTKTDNSGILWLISPSLRDGLGYTGCVACGAGGTHIAEPTTANGANVTYISPYSGNFEAADGAVLAAISVGINTQAPVTAVGNVFVFQTAKGKKGLLKVISLTAVSGSSGTAIFSVKVLN